MSTLDKDLPEYYHSMYLDGYEPYEILEAHRRTMRDRFTEEEIPTVKIISEVKIK